jgi:hypothetical protein
MRGKLLRAKEPAPAAAPADGIAVHRYALLKLEFVCCWLDFDIACSLLHCVEM